MKTKSVTNALLASILFLFLTALTASAQVPEESFNISGTVEGVGRQFEITDSEYLNITLESSEDVSARIESAPEMIVLDIKASGSAPRADFILSGFPANATFHKYQDGYENYAPLTSDQNGVISFEQDISQNHIIFIQPRKSTKIISNDAAGGHCALIGSWDQSSKTCTLNKNVNETIYINNDNITLDGGGHIVTGFGMGINISNRQGVVIKNITISGFSNGVYLYRSNYNRIENSTFENNYSGIYSNYSHYNQIRNNIVRFSGQYGLRVYASYHNNIADNFVGPGNYWGISQQIGGGNIYENNTVLNNNQAGIELAQIGDGILRNNKIESNTNYGIFISQGKNITMKNNSMIGNSKGNFYINANDMAGNDIDISNTVEGRPVYYVKNISDETFDESKNVGSFYCINCENVTLKNISLAEKGSQIFLWHTNNSLVENVKSSDKSIEARFSYSSNNTVKSNDLGKIDLNYYSNGNKIYNNNFSDMSTPARNTLSDGNLFNHSLPEGGNYWKKNEASCKDLNKNGFCDSPYKFYENGTDNYPLVKEIDFNKPTCCSSVMFLPGHQASRLYRDDSGDEDRLWEPTNRNEDVRQLYLDPEGRSVDSGIYTRDIIDETYAGVNIYKGFMDFMDKMVSDGAINKWQYIPYDWRLPLEEIAEKGVKLENGEIGNILREIRNLAAASKTGKVTLVGHSNGGLLGKTVINELKKTGEENLVDRLVMVATPQLGTPKAMAGLLHGDEINLLHGFLLDKETARVFAENMTSAFNLLPSKKYFDIVESPVVEFDPDVDEIFDFPALYGNSVDNWDEFKKFLLGDDGKRSKPKLGDTDSPNVLSEALLDRSEATHRALDDWQAPEGMEVIQIAGWGLDTIQGIRYEDCDFIFCPDNLNNLDRSLILTQDGDETVVVPSAVEMGEDAERYYVDINEYNDNESLIVSMKHAYIMEIEQLQNFIKNIIQKNRTLTEYMSTEKPVVEDEDERLRFRLHSPVSLDIYDQNGNHTGIIDNPDSDLRLVEEQIPNSYYLEFGETKYAGAGDYPIDVKLVGEGLGTFTFEIDHVAGEQVAKNTTFANVPVMEGMKAEVSVSETVGEMTIDFDNDGQADVTLVPGEELDQADLLEIFQKVVYYLNIEETVKDRLINKIDNAEKQMKIGHGISANAMLENVKQQIETFSREDVPEKFTISEDDAEKLIEIINKIQAV